MTPLDSRRLVRGLALARAAVAVAVALGAAALPGDLTPGSNRGLLGGVLGAAIVLSVGLLAAPRTASPRRVAWIVSLVDAALITGVVAATGGARSIFTFLYVLLATGACLLLARPGGVTIAAVSSVLYIALVVQWTIVPMASPLAELPETAAYELLSMFTNAGTLLVVAIVAGGLAERFHSTRRELESRRRDLRDLEAFTSLVFRSVSTGLIAVDEDGRVTAFNRAAEGITGMPGSAALGQPWSSLFEVALPEPTDGGADRRAPWQETVVRRADGTTVPVRITFSPLRDGHGRRLGLIAACEDLSTIRAMEERMRAADRLATLGRMAANIAHEIRNPLASLSGAIEVLAAGTTAEESRQRLADIVLRETERLNHIIASFLEYARPVPVRRVRVNVAEVLDEVLVLLEHRAQPEAVKIVRGFPATLAATVDPQQFRQAVWNLGLNAVQAMPDGGELRVSAAVAGDRLRVRVSDTGGGIAPEDLPHVFEPFFSTKRGGTGLGLALVHRIVQDHGGRVDVESVPGVGSSFTLDLPADG
ncbi:MAG TPA: ATP-binding protein [Candidatus Tectomicrobia bacterium]|nr:ATP-binding protein [Candidatus Tectomicrobia bacterium]